MLIEVMDCKRRRLTRSSKLTLGSIHLTSTPGAPVQPRGCVSLNSSVKGALSFSGHHVKPPTQKSSMAGAFQASRATCKRVMKERPLPSPALLCLCEQHHPERHKALAAARLPKGLENLRCFLRQEAWKGMQQQQPQMPGARCL